MQPYAMHSLSDEGEFCIIVRLACPYVNKTVGLVKVLAVYLVVVDLCSQFDMFVSCLLGNRITKFQKFC